MTSFRKSRSWPACRGYSLCKMGTLAQKLKFSETSKKKDSRVNLQSFCEGNSLKKHLMFEKSQVFENRKIGYRVKAIAFAKWSSWLRNLNSLKHRKNDSRVTLELFCAKRSSKQPLIFEKWQVFENQKVGHHAKDIAFAK